MSNRILAVDDSTSMRQMVTFTLSSAGFDVTEAEDGVVALSLARKQKFDLVLADVNMPNMDGLTMAQAIRTEMGDRDVRIVMLTTEDNSAIRARGREVGVTGWIVKPFRGDAVLGPFRRFCGMA